MLNAKKCSNLAEREGFEPSVPVTQYARLAIWCLRPLGHLSARRNQAPAVLWPCGYAQLCHRISRAARTPIDATPSNWNATISEVRLKGAEPGMRRRAR